MLVDQLEEQEEKLKDCMLPFLQAIFSRFHSRSEIWQQVLSITTELDCLASLAIVSGSSELPMCVPEIIANEGEYENKALFDIKEMVHPCV